MQAQPKGLDARFKPLEEARLEDPDESLLPTLIPFMRLLVEDRLGFAIRFELVGGQRQALNRDDNLVVESRIGCTQAA